MLWSDNFMIPSTSDKADLASEFINYFYDPKNAAVLTLVHPVHLAGRRACRAELTEMGGDAAKLVDNPLVNPTDEFLADAAHLRSARARRRGEVRQAVRGDHRHGLTRGRAGRPGEEAGAPGAVAAARARAALPVLLLLLPALHAVPDVAVGVADAGSRTRCSAGSGTTSPTRSRSTATSSSGRSEYAAHRDAARAASSRTRSRTSSRSAAGGSRASCSVWSSSRSSPTSSSARWRGRRSSATRAPSSGCCRDIGILGPTGALLRTPVAVIGGLTYNFLPFMVLPIYVRAREDRPAPGRRGA